MVEPYVPQSDGPARQSRGQARAFERRLVRALREDGLLESRAPRLAARSAIAAVAIAGILVVNPLREADASGGELAFAGEPPAPAAAIDVRYSPGPSLAGEERLVLRGRYVYAYDGRQYGSVSVGRVATLTRFADEDVLRAGFVWPDSALYGVFVVETEDGTRLDVNGGGGWDLVVTHDGEPTLAGTIARIDDLRSRNWEASLDAARLAVGEFRDDPWAMAQLVFLEQLLEGAVLGDSLRERHVTGFERLHDLHRESGETTVQTEAGMWVLARTIGDSAREAFWAPRLRSTHEPHWLVAQAHLIPVMAENFSMPAVLADSLERLWDRFGPIYLQVPLQGLLTAERTNRGNEMLTWGDRLLRTDAEQSSWLGMRWARSEAPALRDAGLALLRERVERLAGEDSGSRGLFVDSAEGRRRLEARLQRARTALGIGLIAAGRVPEGRSELERAVESGWSVEAYRALGEARLSTGDEAGAVEAWAHVAADPSTLGSFADSVAARIAGYDDRTWTALVSRARTRMVSATLSTAGARPIDLDARLRDSRGRAVRLGSVIGDTTTVVAFWSRFCGPSLAQLPDLPGLAKRLEALGARLIAVTDEPPSDELSGFLERTGLTELTVLHDHERRIARTFGQWATPEFYVVDRDGTITFDRTNIADIVRQAVVTAIDTSGTSDEPVRTGSA